MAGLLPVFLKSEKLQASQKTKVEFLYVITGAKTGRLMALTSFPALTGYDAASMTTALIDAYMLAGSGQPGSPAAGDIPGDTCFDATSLGVDAIGFAVNSYGQAAKAVGMRVTANIGGTVSEVLTEASQSALTSSLSTAMANSAYGNMYGRIVVSGLDAATSGFLHVVLHFESK